MLRVLRVRRSFDSLSAFIKAGWDTMEPDTPLVWGRHMDAICEHLEAVTSGTIKRLLINCPSGHAKSSIVSIFWPAWMWLRQPEWCLLSGSRGMELAIRDATKARSLIQSDWYQHTFQPEWRLSGDQNVKSFYRNSSRGERKAVSVGSNVTGWRADGCLLDDPLDAMDAYSQTARDEANKWLDESFSNRLRDPVKGFIVIIMQRLAEDDPSGHVLEQGGYEHLMLPSYFEQNRRYQTSVGTDWRTQEGELLFPERFTKDVLEAEERRMTALPFAGQHQQRPSAAKGTLVKAEMLCRDEVGEKFWPWPDYSSIMDMYLSFDTAVSTNEGADMTAGAITFQASDGYSYLYPLTLKRLDINGVVRELALSWAQWKLEYPNVLRAMRVEEGAAGTPAIQEARNLIMRAQVVPSPIELALSARAMAKPETERTPEESAALRRVMATQPPNDQWRVEEWNRVRQAPPMVLNTYRPGELFTLGRGRKGDILQRVYEVLPYLNGKNCRLLEAPVSRAWLGQLLVLPNGRHDDAVQATIGGLLPFVTGAQDSGCKPITREMLDAVTIRQ
jgi:hypothetical protein